MDDDDIRAGEERMEMYTEDLVRALRSVKEALENANVYVRIHHDGTPNAQLLQRKIEAALKELVELAL